MRICLGGTFHPFHSGHEALLKAAIVDATHLFVGITDGKLADRPDRSMPPWEQRADIVGGFIEDELAYTGELTVRALTDGAGPAASGDYDVIVVSPETVAGAHAINKARAKAKLPALAIRTISHSLADDYLPISSTRVALEDIDRDGRRITAVRIAVGSGNPVKVAAVDQEFDHILGAADRHVEHFAVPSGVPEQPRLDETLTGARNRALAARAAWPECDYAVGVEAGLNQDHDGKWYDVQCCVIVDCNGSETIGWGPAFPYPDWVTKRALAGEMVSDILGPVANDPRIGGTTGAIGFLTDGHMDRTALTRHAVLMAFVPRFRADLYSSDPTA